jgi:hypothetical protein
MIKKMKEKGDGCMIMGTPPAHMCVYAILCLPVGGQANTHKQATCKENLKSKAMRPYMHVVVLKGCDGHASGYLIHFIISSQLIRKNGESDCS